MDLIQEWNRVPYGDEITLLNESGKPICSITKKGSFAHIIRRLTEMNFSEVDILSDRWRWRVV